MNLCLRSLAHQPPCLVAEAYILYFRLTSVLLEYVPRHASYGLTDNAPFREWCSATARVALAKLDEIQTEFQARRAAEQARATLAAPRPPVLSAAAAPVASSHGSSGVGDSAAHIAGGAGTTPAASAAALGASTAPPPQYAASAAPPASAPPAYSTADPATAAAGGAGTAPYSALLDMLHGAPAAPSLPAAASAPPPAAFPPYPGAAASSYPGSSFSGGARGGAPSQLRPLRFPRRLIETFGDLAHANNALGDRGIETCGILAGRAGTNGDLIVTHLIVPKQRGSADNCEMLDEDALLMYCLAEGLITVGWIHVSRGAGGAEIRCQVETPPGRPSFRRTRPSRASYHLSTCTRTAPTKSCCLKPVWPEAGVLRDSIDVPPIAFPRSSCPSAAVAIVLAPRDPQLPYAAFRLTDEPPEHGLAVVQHCEVRGSLPHAARRCATTPPPRASYLGVKLKGFHPHKEGRLFVVAEHCVVDDSCPLKVCDMR